MWEEATQLANQGASDKISLNTFLRWNALARQRSRRSMRVCSRGCRAARRWYVRRGLLLLLVLFLLLLSLELLTAHTVLRACACATQATFEQVKNWPEIQE